MSSILKINSMQMNMIDSCRLSGGIQQYMDDEDYTYGEAVETVLKNEGWELRDVLGYKEFYNKDTGHVANPVNHNGMLVPVTSDPFITNAFRSMTDGVHSWLEPNEWESPYDCRKGRRLMKKNEWRRERQRKKEQAELKMGRDTIY